MSAKEQDRARTLAERIASRLAKDRQPEHDAPAAARRDSTTAANVGDELAALRASVSEIGQRLRQIESHVVVATTTDNRTRSTGRADMSEQQPSQIRPPQNDPTPSAAHGSGNPQRWLSNTYVPAVHPSEERFGIDEAVSELVEFFEREKVCNVEPGGKPCDHCGMCSSRGF